MFHFRVTWAVGTRLGWMPAVGPQRAPGGLFNGGYATSNHSAPTFGS